MTTTHYNWEFIAKYLASELEISSRSYCSECQYAEYDLYADPERCNHMSDWDTCNLGHGFIEEAQLIFEQLKTESEGK